MSIVTDLRWAVRQFRRRPAIPVIIVLSLGPAMGIGSSLFSVVNAVWFKPWPVSDPDRLRVVSARVALDEWRSWPRETRTFAGLAADRPGAFMRLGRQRLFTRFVSGRYFQVLRVPMALGRTLLTDDSSDVAVISHELWQQRFAGDPNIVGRLVTLESVADRGREEPVTVVGVVSQEFSGLDLTRVHVWRPLSEADRSPSDSAATLTIFGRLVPGVSDRQAQAELSVIRSRVSPREQTPNTVTLVRTDRFSLSPPSLETSVRWTGLIAGLVFVTLIACANVSNLMLASGYSRRGEVALRLSLGARRGGIIRQLLIESFIVSVAAGAIGVGIASWLPNAMVADLARQVEARIDFAVDEHVLIWSMAVSVVGCFAFGLVPALRSTDLALAQALKEGQENSRRALVPSLLSYQTIVSVMAIVVAGLILRSAPVANAREMNTLLADVSVVRLDPPRELNPAEGQALLATMRERFVDVVGSTAVAGMVELQWLPQTLQSLHVTPEYFSVLRIPLLTGRTFEVSDPSTGVVVINEAFARRFWPEGNALAQIVSPDDDRFQDKSLMGRQVIGVVANAPLSNPLAYVPANAADVRLLLVRAPRDRTAREALDITAGLPWSTGVEVMSAREWVSPAIGPGLFAALITTGFGVVALLLGVVGFFSLLEYSVQQRTREIGIRRALGAGAGAIVRSIVGEAVLPLARGLAVGSVGAALLATYMRRVELPTGVNPLDLVVYTAVAALLGITAAAAAYAPTRRALRIEPVKALRVD